MNALNGYSKIVPIDGLILVKVHEQDKTKGGLFVPDQAKDVMPCYGEIIAVGPDVRGLDVGMCVHPRMGASVGRIFGAAGEEYQLWRRDQILAIVWPAELDQGEAAE